MATAAGVGTGAEDLGGGGAEAGARRGPAPGEWLVVYGSLMRGLTRAEGVAGDLLDRLGVGAGLRRVGPCRVPGVLYDLGPYPGLCAARRADEVVCGELHAVLDPAVFAVLDRFEGFDPADRAGSDYLREQVPLVEPHGVSAWIYVYNHRPDAARRIASGDWRRHLAERTDPPHDCE